MIPINDIKYATEQNKMAKGMELAVFSTLAGSLKRFFLEQEGSFPLTRATVRAQESILKFLGSFESS